MSVLKDVECLLAVMDPNPSTGDEDANTFARRKKKRDEEEEEERAKSENGGESKLLERLKH